MIWVVAVFTVFLIAFLGISILWTKRECLAIWRAHDGSLRIHFLQSNGLFRFKESYVASNCLETGWIINGEKVDINTYNWICDEVGEAKKKGKL